MQAAIAAQLAREACPRVGCANMQDADKHAGRTSARVVRDGPGRGQACRTRTSSVPTMDEEWYCLHVFRVDPTRTCLPGWWMDVRWRPGHVPCPAHQAGCACFYAENIPTHPTLVHSREAPCVHPAGYATQRAWFLPTPPHVRAACRCTCVLLVDPHACCLPTHPAGVCACI